MPESQTTRYSIKTIGITVFQYPQPDGLSSPHSLKFSSTLISAKSLNFTFSICLMNSLSPSSQMSITNFLMCFLAVVLAVAGEPTGYRPAMANQAPVYKAPAYQAPAYKAPAYQPPAYQPPAPKAPAYQPPAPKAPTYMAPAPAYMAPAPAYKAASAYYIFNLLLHLAFKSNLTFSSKMSILSFTVCFLAAVTIATADPGYGYRQAAAYSPPAYQAPAYRAPAYQAPAYRAPAYQAPMYKAPAYQAPAYRAPAYQPAAYRAPAYMAPARSY
ncbi:hypothetical protein GHT06_020673 [Daphnia sinensis]|uniref:Uncharacterized protein n=1 Tax=Daphnia sinensis TaxID=1820382 RepID=A0AAD5PPB6_9CRUS|nr:hypothetical protein GHT06_020673 [Daphnia sinensis]